jgi:hypothetical protein
MDRMELKARESGLHGSGTTKSDAFGEVRGILPDSIKE